ncbi:MAG: N-acetylglucosamine-6-phosphate deacetylase [Chloroflexota bacterium]
MIAFKNAAIYEPAGVIDGGVLLVSEGKIIGCGATSEVQIPPQARVIDMAGYRLLPGMIDLHVHGLLGFDAMGNGLVEVIRELPRFGVTSFLATTHALPLDEINSRLQEMADVLSHPPSGACCLGIHLEGPYLSPEMAGMMPPEYLHPLTREEFQVLQAVARKHIRMLTLAPEEGDALHLIPYLTEQGVVPTIGHSNASYELVSEAVELGLRHASHTFNAMRKFHHRDPGVVGAVLAFPQITAQLIADGVHVHEGAMRALINAKGVDGVCLVSDAAPCAGLPLGEYDWDGQHLFWDGQACRMEDGTLAGAYHLMDTGFRNLLRLVGLEIEQATVCSSVVPSRVLGLETRKGRLLPGFDADLMVLNDACQVQMTLVGGQVAWWAEDFNHVVEGMGQHDF